MFEKAEKKNRQIRLISPYIFFEKFQSSFQGFLFTFEKWIF
jgi:hypothetical protein